MRMAETPRPHSDRDLASMAEARTLARQARTAQLQLAELSQDRIDAIVDGMAAAIRPHVEALAREACEETGFGVVADKIQKNRFACDQVHAFIRPMTTVGVLRRDDTRKIIEIAEPFGVVAGIVPSTNPTSTAIYKILIALKARCAIVLSPHPSAVRCISHVASLMAAAADAAGAPPHSVGWMTTVTLEGTQELMRQREVAVILATGGLGLVRSAYSAGKPAYGVGPGNAPCYVHASADVAKAAADIVLGKTFDNGLLCSSPNSVVADRVIDAALRDHLRRQGAHFLSPPDIATLAAALVTPQRLPNPTLVGRSAADIAARTGLDVPAGTRVLVAELEGVGRDHPLSIEKLCPVLSYYVVSDWRAGCERCKEILRYGGMGHTMSVHATDDDVVLQFGLHKPAFRIVVNTPTTHGSIGLTTGLDPAMTLGCGGFGGNITSDNISPLHLLNIKRVAYELRPASHAGSVAPAGSVGSVAAAPSPPAARPAVPARPRALDAGTLAGQIAAFLSTRGIQPGRDLVVGDAQPPASASPPVRTAPEASPEVAFVCEDDVRQAIKAGRSIRLAPRAIVTPAARDLGDAHGIFEDVEAGLP
jgi:acetaldehyde dehydrogenase (acetylating)